MSKDFLTILIYEKKSLVIFIILIENIKYNTKIGNLNNKE